MILNTAFIVAKDLVLSAAVQPRQSIHSAENLMEFISFCQGSGPTRKPLQAVLKGISYRVRKRLSSYLGYLSC